MTSTVPPVTGSYEDRELGRLLRRAGARVTPSALTALHAHLTRAHRAHWWGVVGSGVATAAGLLGSTENSGALLLVHLLAGYLAGSLVADLLSPERRAPGPLRSASLQTRLPRQLAPRWTRILPWITLPPGIASPLLLLGNHPRRTIHLATTTGSVDTSSTWFPAGALIASAAIALAALVAWRLALWKLVRRRPPNGDPDVAAVDWLARVLSARAAGAAAGALGMAVISGVLFLSGDPLVSMDCTTPTDCHYLYALHDRVGMVETASPLLLFAAVLVLGVGRIRRVPSRLLTSAGLGIDR